MDITRDTSSKDIRAHNLEVQLRILVDEKVNSFIESRYKNEIGKDYREHVSDAAAKVILVEFIHLRLDKHQGLGDAVYEAGCFLFETVLENGAGGCPCNGSWQHCGRRQA